MTSKDINTGGLAFPLYAPGERFYGMTLLDYFAAKAMQALIPLHHQMGLGFVITAEDSYRMAQAMLKAKND